MQLANLLINARFEFIQKWAQSLIFAKKSNFEISATFRTILLSNFPMHTSTIVTASGFYRLTRNIEYIKYLNLLKSFTNIECSLHAD
jgi:hypothetical protein